MVRVLFLTLYPDVAASPRYRVWQYIAHLESHGVHCTVQSPLTAGEWAALTGPGRKGRPFWYHARETVRRMRQVLAAGRYDIVFVQKAIMTAYIKGLPELLRTRARRLVYDIDDAVHLAPPHPLKRPWNLIEDRAQIHALFRTADLVLAGNAWLTEAARASGARAELLPTVVDTQRFAPAGGGDGVYRIGWVGNPSTTICLEPAAEALRRVPHAQVCLIGGDPARVALDGCEFRPWNLQTETAELHRLSVGIMPQPAEEWMRGKCALKALQYMACGIPCIASPFGAILDIIQPGTSGLFAEGTAGWLDAFERLRDPGLRRQMGMAGRTVVEERYSLGRTAPRLLELLQSLA